MLKLRKFLCGCFGFLALLFLVISAGTLPSLVFRIHEYGLLPPVHSARVPLIAAICLGVLARLVLALPLVLSVLYGMAWWSVKRGKASARGWAIAASLAILLQSIPFSLVAYLEWAHGGGHWVHQLVLSGIALALGVAGLVAFARRGAAAQVSTEATHPARIAGDGTSAIVDRLAWILGVCGYFAGQSLWMRWAQAQHLPVSSGFQFLWLILAAGLLETAAHECGHIAVGLALGMRLRAFVVGPFQWHIRDGKWKFQFLLNKILSGGGAAGMVPVDPEQSRWREIWMIAAGPLASLCTGLIALVAALLAKGSPYERTWELLALIATFGLVAFAVNLIPFRPKPLYSDGALIFQLLRGGPMADFRRALNFAGAILVTSLRPRDYDIQAIQRASSALTEGHQAVLLRFLAYNYFHDCNRIPEACHALDDAESVYHRSAQDIPAEWHMLFVFGNAFLKRDAASARQWWNRMEAKKATNLDEVYWLAKSALHWIENNVEQANEAWTTGNELAQRRPKAGAYEFNRDCFLQLRQALDEAPTAEAL